MSPNFAHLRPYDDQLVRLGVLAERYFPEDPNTALLKLRQLGELLAQQVACRFGVELRLEETQQQLIRRLELDGILDREVAELFHVLRRKGNLANHELQGDHATALKTLRFAWQLGVWFHRSFGDPQFRSGPFQPPQAPASGAAAADQELLVELEQLRQDLAAFQAAQGLAAEQLAQTEAQLQQALQEQEQWEQLATAVEADKAALAARLAELQAAAQRQGAAALASLRQASRQAADRLELDEAATRLLIDEQLRQAGWEADSQRLRYSQGARPQKHRNLAIAEWLTASGPADYVLFAGLTPLAAVEAKRAHKDVAGVVPQAERYCRTVQFSAELEGQAWGPEGEFRLPFAFAGNGRRYLRQLETKSGVWFRDLRRSTNLAVPLDGWYSPQGLLDLARQDIAKAEDRLQREAFSYGFPLRPYQRRGIEAVEAAIRDGQRQILLAMATGTGKTKTCIALIYRLLKTGRFRRVLFLVDRSELGNQAADAFKETRMESLQSFADIFGIKELGEKQVESDTRVHIATVQAMVQRLLLSDDERPNVDTYDLIIVDECHRGYLLDRELSDRELRFRDFNDYISKYRRVLELFDAVRIGLTATPALHTKEIFGEPVFVYSYREAVVDGYLVDHEPPIRIQTELAAEGIRWQAGEEVKLLDPKTGQISLFNTPDALGFEVEAFNRQVITESFNRVVCEALADELDPFSPLKTLIFCATDGHADLVVRLLKLALQRRYGSIEDEAVTKITGASDKPAEWIRRYKNERFPNVAVTVDLLSTGVDVPAIGNIVFLRRMNSRILYDQMIGRATRLCEPIGKESFRIFDAVGIYEALQAFTDMKPVVVNPNLSYGQLIEELTRSEGPDDSALIRQQLIAKLRRKRRHLSEKQEVRFQQLTGEEPDVFISRLQALPLAEAQRWLGTLDGLGALLDAQWEGPRTPQLISEHEDQLRAIEHGYGEGQRPEDYLEGFRAFVKDPGNELPALTLVVQRPWELSRKDLRELKLALDQRGYNEASLTTAWRDTTNQEMAASIMGYIRQAALGDALVPYAQRVEKALQRILASQEWTKPQRDWLQRIANQTKVLTIVDREALDDDALFFRREGGGWNRLNRMFDDRLDDVLQTFLREVWAA